jgi:hypothetical protein
MCHNLLEILILLPEQQVAQLWLVSPYRVGEFGPEIFYPGGTSGSIRKDTGGGGSTIININGVIDAESASRIIEKLLQNSARRTSPINLVGATL